jgi:hypothetical protein
MEWLEKLASLTLLGLGCDCHGFKLELCGTAMSLTVNAVIAQETIDIPDPA